MKLNRKQLQQLLLKEFKIINEQEGSDEDLDRTRKAIDKISDPAVKKAFNMLLIYMTGMGGEA